MELIKKYANRKLYHTNRKQYITLEGIAALIQAGQQVRVVDNATGTDITASILSQVVLQTRSSRSPLPAQVLASLIQAGGDPLASLRRAVWAALGGTAAIDSEIGQRVQWLREAGAIDDAEAARLQRLLRESPSFVVPGGGQEVPSSSDVARLADQIDALTATVEQLLAEREGQREASGLIGILAGMGPRSTAPFIDLVITECQRQYGAQDDIDFPPMMIYSLPTPFYADRPVDHDAMKAAICAGLQELERTGVDFIAMPCNTAHIYYDEVAACVRVPLLNMIDELVPAIPTSARRVALLATRQTIEAGMYQTALRRAGFEPVASDQWQRQVDHLIHTIKVTPDPAAALEQWQTLIRTLETSGADAAILACTDLNAVRSTNVTSLTLLDATETLARAVVGRWRGQQI